jgi:hypothetical protein
MKCELMGSTRALYKKDREEYLPYVLTPSASLVNLPSLCSEVALSGKARSGNLRARGGRHLCRGSWIVRSESALLDVAGLDAQDCDRPQC